MNISELYEKLREKFAEGLSLSESQMELLISSRQLVAILRQLKEQFGFAFLSALTAVDYTDRFEMVYCLMSLEDASLVTVKVHLGKAVPSVPSIVTLWPAANVQEREVYDMFGIQFEGHPNLKRILNTDDFEGFPLRKTLTLPQVDRQSR